MVRVMGNDWGSRVRLVSACGLVILFILLTAAPATAMAADAVLPIKARFFRCITQEERRSACDHEDICCQYLDDPQALAANAQDSTFVLLQLYPDPAPRNGGALWMRSLSQQALNPPPG